MQFGDGGSNRIMSAILKSPAEHISIDCNGITKNVRAPVFESNNTNRWNHVVYTYSNGYIAIYLNGLQTGTTTTCTNFVWGSTKSNNAWMLFPIPGVGNTYRIDDFRVYSRAFTASEVNWLYKPCVTEQPFYDDTYTCPCAAGSLSVNGVCVPCAAGSYAPAGVVMCTNCSAGKYSNVTGASSASVCTNCTVGTYSTAVGSSSSVVCMNCLPGKYSGVTGASACANCSAGSYSVAIGATSSAACVACPAGAYSGTAGASSSTVCVLCPAGTYSNVTGASSAAACVTCAAGTFAAAGANACAKCPVGTYSTVTGTTSASACVLCPVGLYSIAGSSVCTCAVGQVVVNSLCTYNDPALSVWYKFEATNPTNWGSNTLNIGSSPTIVTSSDAKEGSTSAVVTSRLQKTGSTTQEDTTVFTISFWIKLDGSSSPGINYGGGSYFNFWVTGTNINYATDVTNGNPVTFYNFAGDLNKWLHIVATHNYGTANVYVNGILQNTRVKSEYTSGWTKGIYWFFDGNSKMDDFRIYSRVLTANEIMWVYKPCEVDAPFYFDTYICPCGAGYISVNQVCVPGTSCPAGTYFGAVASICINCEVGKYSITASSTCTNCPAGAYSTVTGTSACVNCEAGKYSNLVGVSVCTNCAGRYYSTVIGATTSSVCVQCPTGKYASPGSNNANACRTCFPGEVLVSSQYCTYDDPDMLIYLPFKCANPNTNNGSVRSAGDVSASTSVNTSNNSIRGDCSAKLTSYNHITNTFLIIMPYSKNTLTISFWLYMPYNFTDGWDYSNEFWGLMVSGIDGWRFRRRKSTSVASDTCDGRMPNEETQMQFKADSGCWKNKWYKTPEYFQKSSEMKWTHFVWVFDISWNTWSSCCSEQKYYADGRLYPSTMYGSTTFMHLWKDGVAVLGNDNNNLIYHGYVSPLASPGIGSYVRFGALGPDVLQEKYSLKGLLIDDIRIYKRALSATEIQWLYSPCGGGVQDEDTKACLCNAGYSKVNFVCVACQVGTYSSVVDATACTTCMTGKYSTVSAATSADVCINCPTSEFEDSSGFIISACGCDKGLYQVVVQNTNIQNKCGVTKNSLCSTSTTPTTETGVTIGTCTGFGENPAACGVLGTIWTTSYVSVDTTNKQKSLWWKLDFGIRTTVLQVEIGLYHLQYYGEVVKMTIGDVDAINSNTICSTFSGNPNAIFTRNCNLKGRYLHVFTECLGVTCSDMRIYAVKVSESSDTCTKCPAGKFKNTTGSGSCTNCSVGSYSEVSGSAVCTKCPAASTSVVGSSSASVCMNCAFGSYAADENSTNCTKCPAGLTTTAGARSIDDCFELDCGSSVKDMSFCNVKCEKKNTIGPANACTMYMTTSNATASCNSMIAVPYKTQYNRWVMPRSDRELTTCLDMGHASACYGTGLCQKTCNPRLTKGRYMNNSALQFRNPLNLAINGWNRNDVNFVNPLYSSGVNLLVSQGLTIITVVKFLDNANGADHLFDFSEGGLGWGQISFGRRGRNRLFFNMYSPNTGHQCQIMFSNAIVLGEWMTVSIHSTTYSSVTMNVWTQNGTFLTTTARRSNDCSISWGTTCCQNEDTIWSDRNTINKRIKYTSLGFNFFFPYGYAGFSPETTAQLLNADVAGLVLLAENMTTTQARTVAEGFEYGQDMLAAACLCKPGFYLDLNTEACVLCPVDYYCLRQKMIQCPGGTFTNGALGAISCKPMCEAGAYILQGVCVQCEVGRYIKYSSIENECLQCPVNTFSVVAGATVCSSCPVNSISQSSSSSITACMCTAGSSGQNGGSCVLCVAGKYKNTTGNDTCLDCAASTYSATVGATGTGACLNCPANAVSGAGSGIIGSCVCNVGATGPNGGVCSLCAVGKYKSVNGTAACTDCWAGSYSGVLGANSSDTCLNCPNNSWVAGVGSSLVTACTCNAGASGPNGGPCALCVPGKYKTVSGTAVCTNCSANTFSTVVGATSILACSNCGANSQSGGSSAACVCNKGYTGPDGGVCLPCVAGTFKTGIGSAECTLCANNTFSGVVGSTNASVCQSCQANAISAAGSVDQEYCYCKPGYAHLEGRHSCRQCTPGTYNSQLAQRACSNCTIGMYSLNYSAISPETCKYCPAGQWSPEGSANCNLCPAYSRTLAISGLVTDCVCDPGYIGPGGSTCVACAAGLYKDVQGPEGCVSCPALTSSFPGTVRATDCWCVSGYIKVSGVCVAMIPRPIQISGSLENLPVNPSPAQIQNATQQLRQSIAAQFNVAIELVQVDAVANSSNVQVLLFARSETEVALLQRKVSLATAAPTQSSLPFLLVATGNASVGEPRTVLITVDVHYAAGSVSRESEAMFALLTEMSEYFDVPVYDLSYAFDASGSAAVPRVVISVRTESSAEFVRVSGSSQALLAQGNVTLPELSVDVLAVGDSGPGGLNFTRALIWTNGSAMSAAEVQAAMPALLRQLSWFYNVPAYDISVVVTANASACVDFNATSTCFDEIYSVQVFVGANTMVSTENLQARYLVMSETVETPIPLVLELPFELDNVFYFTDTGVSDFYVEMELVESDGLFLSDTQVAQADETLTWHLADFFGVDASRVHFETIAPRFPMLNNASNVRVWLEVAAGELPGLLQRASQLVGKATLLVQPAKIAGLANAVQAEIFGQMVDGRFVQCPPNYVVDAQVCKCKRGYVLSAALCVPCAAGAYSSALDEHECANCSTATFSLGGATACTGCHANSNSAVASTSQDACQCDPGYFFFLTLLEIEDGVYNTVDNYCVPCVNGSFKGESGNFNCSDCEAEYYSADAFSCNTCNSGYALNDTNSSACEACPQGSFKAAPGSAACVACAADTFSNATAALSCESCPAGYRSLSGTVESEDCCAWNSGPVLFANDSVLCLCNAGYTGPDAGASKGQCAACSSGAYKDSNGSAACSNCSVGTYSPAVAADSDATCEMCAAGQYAAEASANCTICPENAAAPEWSGLITNCLCNSGFTGPDGGLCVACPSGTYKPTNGSATCTRCPLNSNSSAGSADIIDCFCDAWCSGPAGGPCISNNSTLNATSGEDQCSPGFTGPDRTGPCFACALGKYKTEPGPAACTNCAPGQYQDALARTSCWSCAPDTFSNASGAQLCTECPAGFRALSATTTIRDCCALNSMPFSENSTIGCSCNVGYTGPDAGDSKGECSACVPGTHKASNGSADCTNCSVGTYSPAVAADSNTTCTMCPAGQYAAEGSASCVVCPANSAAPTWSGSITDCLCNMGYTGPNGGTCVSCLVGTYKDSNGTANCTGCPLNSNSSDASTNITDCFCDAWCYGPDGGPCIPNNSTLNLSSGVYQCSPGFTGPDATGPCVACALGKYKNVPGPDACSLCAPGEYQDAVAAIGCSSCAPDSFSNASGSPLCTQCPAGFKSLSVTTTVEDCCNLNSSPQNVTKCTWCNGQGPNVVVSYSTTACVRFIALTPKPSFASISTRTNAAIGNVPTYNPLGGPNGKGHVSFDRTQYQYLDAGRRTFNIATNGGLTVVAVVRFTTTVGGFERIIDLGNGGANMNNLIICRYYLSSNLYIKFWNGANAVYQLTLSNNIVQDSWMTIIVTHRVSTGSYMVNVNGVVTNNVATALTDRTLSVNSMGMSQSPSNDFLTADVAGCFVVDEYLDTAATTAIVDAMIQGVDLTSTPCENTCCVSGILCSCNTGYTGPDTGDLKGQCSACLPGTYKASNGTANCTSCPLNSNSSAGSRNITDCVCDAWCDGRPGGPCVPKNSTFNVTSGVYQCSPGYTGPDRTGPCVACSVGSYKNVPGPAECSLCAPGQYQDALATRSCLSCAPDTFQNASGASVCATCPAGFRALPGTTAVQDCCGLNSKPQNIRCALPTISTLHRSCGLSGTETCSAAQSSIMDPKFAPEAALDRNYATFMHTYLDAIPWWRLDFGGSVIVTKVFIYNRAEGWTRLANFKITVGDRSSVNVNAICASNLPAPRDSVLVTCVTPLRGRYLHISLPSPEYLNVAEVEVTGSRCCVDDGMCTACASGICSSEIVCSCNTGYTGPDSGASKGQCAMCVAGTYKDASGSAACTLCPANSNSSANSDRLSNCSCNPRYTGPNGGPCVACEAGKFKNASGTAACVTCPANTYSASGAFSCTSCPAGFTSPNGSTVSSDCCDPNTTYAKNVYDALSSATKTSLSTVTWAVQISSVPSLGGYGPGSTPPAYMSGGGYNELQFLRFSKISSVSGVNRLSMSPDRIYPGLGLTIVTVVRFVEGMGGMFFNNYWDYQVFGMYLTNAFQLCVTAHEGHWGSYGFCTSAVPINVWLQVSYTYHPNVWPRHKLKVVYLSNAGNTVALSGEGYTYIYRDGGYFYGSSILGYSTQAGCSSGTNPACDRPNFDLAGFYLIQALVPDADIALLLQAMASGSQILFDRIAICQCNTGFGGSGRSDCKSCAAGTYKDKVRVGSCSLCAVNTYSTAVQATNVSTCLSCPNNSVSVAGRFECECNFGYEGGMFECAACVPGKFKRFLGTSSCMDCPANTEATGAAWKVCASLPGYNGLGYALEDVGRSCGTSLSETCPTLSNGATSVGSAGDGALDNSLGTYVSVVFNQNLARSCGNTGTTACATTTGSVYRPWWGVDFGRSRSVFAVNVMSSNWVSTKDFKVVVGDVADAQSPLNTVCADYLVGTGSGYVKFTCEDTVSGRYLYIVNGPHAANSLILSDVTVDAFNYAANASLMIPWWVVDFEVERAVSGLVIQAQTASVIQVRVGHSTDPLQNAVCKDNVTIATAGSNTVNCSSAMLGRYIFVIGAGNKVLVLNDVRVLGFPAAQCAAGTYKPLVGNHNCTACPASSTSVIGATSVAQCSCRAGYLDVWS